jgi:hypothetical protein
MTTATNKRQHGAPVFDKIFAPEAHPPPAEKMSLNPACRKKMIVSSKRQARLRFAADVNCS